MNKIAKIFLAAIILFSFNTFASERCDLKFNKIDTCANIDWVYGPYLDQFCSLKLTINDPSKVSSVKVIPWMVMGSHEHGSRPVKITEISSGEYLIDKAYFMGGMDGSWYFKIQLQNKEQINEEIRYPIIFKQ